MKRLFVFVSVVIISCIIAPTSYGEQYWAKTYMLPHNMRIFDSQQTIDGGYIFVGSIDDPDIIPWRDALVFKVDSHGNVTWSKTFDCINDDDIAYSVQSTSDGGYIVAGTSYTDLEYDLLILKLDSNGTVMWNKYYDAGVVDEARSIKQTSDGGYIMWGFIDTWPAGKIPCIVKLNINGNISWLRTLEGNFSLEDSVYQTLDGGYIMLGNAFDGSNYDLLVLKLNSTGGITWQKTYGGSENDLAGSIKQTLDGGYIVVGGTDSFGAGDRDAWVLKLADNGNIIWQKTYGGSGYEYASSIQQTIDEGFILAGVTKTFGAGDRDAWVLKLADNGNIIWQKTYGGSGSEYARSIQQTLDGDYFLAGSFSANFEREFSLLKLDSTGEIPICNIINTSNASVSDTSASAMTANITTQERGLYSNSGSIASQNSSIDISLICCYDDDDYDCDYILNSNDNCPNTPNQDQLDNYPPQGNGIGDACDCEADFNCDGNVDATDVEELLKHFGRNYFLNPCEDLNQCNRDFECDGDVDAADATMFLQDFGRSQFNNPCPACVVGDWCVYP